MFLPTFSKRGLEFKIKRRRLGYTTLNQAPTVASSLLPVLKLGLYCWSPNQSRYSSPQVSLPPLSLGIFFFFFSLFLTLSFCSISLSSNSISSLSLVSVSLSALPSLRFLGFLVLFLPVFSSQPSLRLGLSLCFHSFHLLLFSLYSRYLLLFMLIIVTSP